MLTIKCDPSGLSQAQREALAGFILAYPVINQCVDEGCPQSATPHICTPEAVIPSKARDGVQMLTFPTIDPELAQLQSESTAPATPAQAFGLTATEAADATPLAPPVTSLTPVTGVPFALVNTVPTSTTLGPVSSVVPAPPAGDSVELDSKGLPWDARIHSDSKAKIADGSWRSKRNLDAAVKAQVEAELRAVMGAPAAPLAHAAIATVAAGFTPNPTSVPVVALPPPPAPVAAELDGRQLFVSLVGRASAAMQAGKITQQQITECCQAHGVPALPLLTNRLDLVGAVAASVDAIIASVV